MKLQPSKTKRIFSMVLVICMVVSVLNLNALATDFITNNGANSGIDKVSIDVQGGTPTIKVTVGSGHSATNNIFAAIYKKDIDSIQGGSDPSQIALGGNPRYPVMSFAKLNVSSGATEAQTLDLLNYYTPVPSTHSEDDGWVMGTPTTSNSGTLPYGEQMLSSRYAYFEVDFNDNGRGLAAKSDYEQYLTDNTLEPYTEEWEVKVWSGQAGFGAAEILSIELDPTTGNIVTPFSASAGEVTASAYDNATRTITVTVKNSTGAEITAAATDAFVFTKGANAPFEIAGTAPTSFAEGESTFQVQLKSGSYDAGTYEDTLTIKGADDSTTTVDLSVTINQKELTLGFSDAAISDKAYDGTKTAAASTPVSVSGFVGSDGTDAAATATYEFADANVGENKTVNVSVSDFTVGAGVTKGNYKLPATKTGTATGKITAAKLTATTLTATKTYDGDADVELADLGANPTVNGVNGETLAVTGITGAAYSSANAHTSTALANKGTITVGNGTGTASNYDASDLTAITINGVITAAALGDVSITNDDKNSNNKIDTGDELSVTLPSGVQSSDVTYSWKIGGTEVGTAATYTVQDADMGKEVTVEVTATGNYTGTKTAEIEVGKTPLAAPEIKGDDKTVGAKLTLELKPAGVTADDVTIQWKRNGADISGANAVEYQLTADDRGTNITATVTAKDGTVYSGTVTSAEVAIPAEKPGKPANLTVTPGDTKLDVDWEAPADNGGSAITGYKVTVTDPEGNKVTFEDGDDEVDEIVVTTPGVELTGLDNDVEYTISVVAVNAAGDGEAATVKGTPAENAAPHAPFMVGYANGDKAPVKFGPDDNLSRAAAVTILARLDGWTDGEKTTLTDTMFSDVKEKDDNGNSIWYYDAICYAKENKLVDGMGDGTFNPDGDITRAEFTKMLSRLRNNGQDPAEADSELPDAKTHWANKWIADIETNCPGSITGREDGLFHPNDKITRAEVAKVINGYLNRLQSVSSKEEDQLSEELNPFDDVNRCTWYYNNVIEATVPHDASDAEFHTAD